MIPIIRKTTSFSEKEKIIVEERISGELFLLPRGKYLSYTLLPGRPKKVREAKVSALTTTKSSWKPPADHLREDNSRYHLGFKKSLRK
jgi:hypothetical protein